MRQLLKDIIIVFVCNDDGVVALSYPELKQILNEEYKQAEWVSISRKKREMYLVKGSDGKLNFKIGESDFVKKIFG